MNNFFGRLMLLAATAFFLNIGTALADSANSDWNDSWGFPTPFEKANLVDQALAIELVENDGFKNETYYGYSDLTTIGNQIIAIDNSINDSVLDSFNTKDSFNETNSTTTTTNKTTTINTDVDIDDSFNKNKTKK